MVDNGEGMKTTYNRFHDPYESGPCIAELRELHGAMDRAVLAAYDWTDIPTECDLLLDYAIDEATRGRKKKPYRSPDPVRDEVLARLFALNTERASPRPAPAPHHEHRSRSLDRSDTDQRPCARSSR